MINLYDLEEDKPGRGFGPIYGIGNGSDVEDFGIWDQRDLLDCANKLGMVPV